MSKNTSRYEQENKSDSDQYVRKTTFFLSLALALLVGGIVGNFVGKSSAPASTTTQREFTGNSPIVAGMNQDTAAAILQHEERLLADPNNAADWQHLGDLYYDSGQPQKSINAYEKSLALKANNPSALVDCGVMYREIDNFDKALEYFQKALKIDPKHEVAHFNSGVVLIHDLKRVGEGVAMWQALLQINPDAKAPSGAPIGDLIKEAEQR